MACQRQQQFDVQIQWPAHQPAQPAYDISMLLDANIDFCVGRTSRTARPTRTGLMQREG
jgi:hypothetical protein